MDRHSLPRLPRFGHTVRRLALLGIPLAGAGCVPDSPAARLLTNLPPRVVRAAEPELLPAPKEIATAETAKPQAANVLPISLDTVLRLAEDQNLKVGEARERVNEAVAQQDLACRWIPDLYVGASYYRHEGGIQLENGDLIHSSTGSVLGGLDARARLDTREMAYQRVSAERKAWEKKGELSRITSETLLDAATTYIDLLTTHAGKAVNRALQTDLEDLRNRAEKLAEKEPGTRVEVSRVKAEIEARKAMNLKLEAQAAGASAKLVWLLGLDPCTELVPVDGDLVAFHLIDAGRPTCDLVAQAVAQGPGVQELAGIVALIEESLAKAKGPGRYMPTFELRMTEGGFGAGPNANLTWDNRWDAALQMRWNLSDFATRHEKWRIAQAQRQQAHYAHNDLQAKLTAGVREAHQDILNGTGQIQHNQSQIGHAGEARKLSQERLKEGIQGSSTGEVLLALQSLGRAQFEYLTALRDYDKAQIQLLVLLGCPTAHPPSGPKAQLPSDVGCAK